MSAQHKYEKDEHKEERDDDAPRAAGGAGHALRCAERMRHSSKPMRKAKCERARSIVRACRKWHAIRVAPDRRATPLRGNSRRPLLQ